MQSVHKKLKMYLNQEKAECVLCIPHVFLALPHNLFFMRFIKDVVYKYLVPDIETLKSRMSAAIVSITPVMQTNT